MRDSISYFLDLSDNEPLFYGTTRRVYRHPHDPALLVKVPSRQEEERRHANRPAWKRRFKPTGIANITNLREMAEIMRLNPEALPCPPHIFSFIGLVATSYGWGQIVKAERDENGSYAPTLESIAQDSSRYEKPLQEFIAWVKTAPIVLIDLEPWNCVLAERNGKQQIVLIDGMGEKTIIPLRTYFPSLNNKKNARQIAQFFNSLELVKQGKTPARRRA
ncbi:YrbL family protein [Candidatus Tokpelaia sp.]|uniref:YrbL family protein n=1 Tax=Candidatus Tokpelaia sp. TaxID=2233777 RepID=UPI0012390D29|nr:YrbL family protein [Candidatus Tokpelaia sp.]KAA6404772.1 hypothetical protein DPQ22_07545 [Candidatus Tokpelaia sp.]